MVTILCSLLCQAMSLWTTVYFHGGARYRKYEKIPYWEPLYIHMMMDKQKNYLLPFIPPPRKDSRIRRFTVN